MISLSTANVDKVRIDESWNFGREKELLMHTIHVYPAKFPAFIAQKAFDYASEQGVKVKTVADVFCGCGTVALEATIQNVDFWGCDINPVATLIAKAKRERYDLVVLNKCFTEIKNMFHTIADNPDLYESANSRLKYWYTQRSYLDLEKLKQSINGLDVEEKYSRVLKCIFSSILKSTSRWLTKSIKPQVDPNKKEIVVWNAFYKQFNKLMRAVKEINSLGLESSSSATIKTTNFINLKSLPKVDMIVSSPPYVTSYEYADLHQLSSLWLDFADDYKTLRDGSIGSIYNCEEYDLDW